MVARVQNSTLARYAFVGAEFIKTGLYRKPVVVDNALKISGRRNRHAKFYDVQRRRLKAQILQAICKKQRAQH